MIQDGGATFASGTDGPLPVLKKVQKANLGGWKKRKIWHSDNKKEAAGFCRANLSKGLDGGSLENPRISEQGRDYLARLLQRLSDSQIADLFTAGQVLKRDPKHKIEDWVAVFKDKVAQIVSMSCETHQAK
jgi:hypothetical protein